MSLIFLIDNLKKSNQSESHMENSEREKDKFNLAIIPLPKDKRVLGCFLTVGYRWIGGWVNEYRVAQLCRIVKTKLYSIKCNFVPCFFA